MAENLQVLKKRIRTSQNIAQIAKAMEMIASSKIKRAQAAVEKHRPYAQRILDTMQRIMAHGDLADFEHPYVRTTRRGRRLLIVYAPDKGLCGGLPGNIYRALAADVEKDTLLVTIGKRAEKFAARVGNTVVASFPMGSSFPSYEMILPVVNIIDRHFPEQVTEVDLLFTEFTTMLNQKPVVMPLLPITLKPGAGVYDSRYLFEPSPAAVLHDLVPRYVETELYAALIQAFTSEQAARMIAMKDAKDNAYDISYYLTNRYNRSRQERITNEILDLANGAG